MKFEKMGWDGLAFWVAYIILIGAVVCGFSACNDRSPTSSSAVLNILDTVIPVAAQTTTILLEPTVLEPVCEPDHRQECKDQEWNTVTCQWEGRCPEPPPPESDSVIVSSGGICKNKDPFCVNPKMCEPNTPQPCPQANWDYCACEWVNFNGAMNVGCDGPAECTKIPPPDAPTMICTWKPEGRDECRRPIGCFWSCE